MYDSEMKRAVLLLLLACAPPMLFAACPVPLQSVPSDAARKAAVSKLRKHLACKADDPLSDQSPCNIFAAKALEDLYGLHEFRDGAG